jgi:hypothetical protein
MPLQCLGILLAWAFLRTFMSVAVRACCAANLPAHLSHKVVQAGYSSRAAVIASVQLQLCLTFALLEFHAASMSDSSRSLAIREAPYTPLCTRAHSRIDACLKAQCHQCVGGAGEIRAAVGASSSSLSGGAALDRNSDGRAGGRLSRLSSSSGAKQQVTWGNRAPLRKDASW